MARPRTKLPRETAWDLVNKTIDWYELNKPAAGRRLEVRMSPENVGKRIGIDPDAKGKWPTEFEYRGRVLVATGEVR